MSDKALSDSTLFGLDLGLARIGLASFRPEWGVRDEGILRRKSLDDDVRRLSEIVAERKVDLIILGLPLNDDGSEGPQAKIVRRFWRKLEAALAERSVVIPVLLFDETDTTVEATEKLGFLGRPLSERERGRVDARSASVLLERYLRKSEKSTISAP